MKVLNIIQSCTNLFVLFTHHFILLHFFHLYFFIQILGLCSLQKYFLSNYIFSNTPRILNTSIDSFSLNFVFIFIFALVFPKIHDDLGFLKFQYLPQITQHFFILFFLIIINAFVLFYYSCHICQEKKICITQQTFAFQHKINKSNTKVSTHY